VCVHNNINQFIDRSRYSAFSVASACSMLLIITRKLQRAREINQRTPSHLVS
jgi:hypothetical protein